MSKVLPGINFIKHFGVNLLFSPKLVRFIIKRTFFLCSKLI
jgi:hypothetical protein